MSRTQSVCHSISRQPPHCVPIGGTMGETIACLKVIKIAGRLCPSVAAFAMEWAGLDASYGGRRWEGMR